MMVQAADGQTADLAQWLTAGGTLLASVDSDGRIRAAGYDASDGTPGMTGSQVIVTGISQDPVTKDISVTTSTLFFKDGLVVDIQ